MTATPAMPAWDLSTFTSSPHTRTASLTPTISKRRGQQIRSAAGLDVDESDGPQSVDLPFPRKSGESGSDEDVDMAQEDAAPVSNTVRTVRRKKSSLDLRDIFLNGGQLATDPSSSPSS